jgi:hypothetical protein
MYINKYEYIRKASAVISCLGAFGSNKVGYMYICIDKYLLMSMYINKYVYIQIYICKHVYM